MSRRLAVFYPVLLALLAALVIAGCWECECSKTVRQVQAAHDIKEIAKVIMAFHLREGRLPESLEKIAGEFEDREVPKDPWANDYIYVVKNPGEFDVISLGRDGWEGGDGPDQDIDRAWRRGRDRR